MCPLLVCKLRTILVEHLRFPFLSCPLHKLICITDKFISNYISPSNAGTDSENNEPGERHPKTMCRQCTDNYLLFDISVVAVKHVLFFCGVGVKLP
jgi:hypothetical protein